MRRFHWTAAVLAMLALLAGGGRVFGQSGDETEAADEGSGRIRLAAQAQPEEEYPYGPYRVPAHPGPPSFDPYSSYRNGIGGGPGGLDPSYPPPVLNSPVAGQAMPPGAQPWPEVSPFMEGQFRQRRNVGGLWFDESNSRGIRYHFSLSYARSQLKRPHEYTVGNPDPTIPVFNPNIPGLFDPQRTTDMIRRNATGNGLEMRWGYDQPDDSGLELRGLWLMETKSKYSKGNQAGDFLDATPLRDTAGISFNDGAGGVVASYDRLYTLTYLQTVAQASFDFSRTPWLKGNFYAVQPMYGGRYLFINEKMAFYGEDSNLNYLITLDEGSAIDGSQSPNPNGIPQYSAFFRSEVDTHLFGPHLGLKYKLGGDYLLIGGHTQGGLMANIENLNLKGRNLGDGFNIDFRFVDSFFSQKLTNSHVSPLFEQNFFVEAPIFRLVPYVNKWHLMKEAKFKAQYTFISVGEVSRPEGNIVYNGFPLVPELRTRRGEWHTSVYSFGIDWKY